MTHPDIPYSQWLDKARKEVATDRAVFADYVEQVPPGPMPVRMAQARLLFAAARRNASHRQAPTPDPKEASDG